MEAVVKLLKNAFLTGEENKIEPLKFFLIGMQIKLEFESGYISKYV